MSRETIIGRAALLALIYCEDTLPSAIIRPVQEQHTPFCVHSLRAGDEATFESLFKHAERRDPKYDPAEIEFHYWPFYEDYPYPTHGCIGCSMNEDKQPSETGHRMENTEGVAKKLCEDCA